MLGGHGGGGGYPAQLDCPIPRRPLPLFYYAEQGAWPAPNELRRDYSRTVLLIVLGTCGTVVKGEHSGATEPGLNDASES